MKTKTNKARKGRRMNTRLLRATQKWVLAHPTQVYMSNWYGSKNQFGWTPEGCGTTGCIAGIGLMLANHRAKTKPRLDTAKAKYDWTTVDTDAEKAFGLTERQSERLFYTADWPVAMANALEETESPEEYAKVVAQRIEQFIKSKGRK